EELIVELQEALANVKTLNGLLPICATCKKIRNDEGYWQQVDRYVAEHTEATFTHGICPDCAQKVMAEYQRQKREDG
ncbi:MAG TPA: response regulator, partial [Bacteroidota bacterium]|nr:response regulator [Bacteroidota bacterium]